MMAAILQVQAGCLAVACKGAKSGELESVVLETAAVGSSLQ